MLTSMEISSLVFMMKAVEFGVMVDSEGMSFRLFKLLLLNCFLYAYVNATGSSKSDPKATNIETW